MSGVGKSTLLSIIAGERPPDRVSVIVEPSGSTPILWRQWFDDLVDTITRFARDWDRDAVRLRPALRGDPSARVHRV